MRNSKSPYRVQKAVFHLSPSLIRIRLYADRRSRRVKYLAPRIWFKVSSILGSRYRSLIVTSLRVRYSTHRRRDPSFFLTNNMGEAQDDELVGINPLERFSSIHLRILCSSEADMEYIRPIGGFLSVLSGISWSTYLCGGNLSAPFLVNKDRKW